MEGSEVSPGSRGRPSGSLLAARLAGVATAGALACLAAAPTPAARSRPATYAPKVQPAHFQARVDHPYFPLVPGTRLVYRETSGGETRLDEVTVSPETRIILGVACTVVRDVLRRDGAVVEDTFDWYAQDAAGNVWYFGEDTKEFGPDGQASTEGSWQAGVNGAQPGILMPARPAVGMTYRQEYLRGHAEDMGEIAALGDTVSVPFGSFFGCVRTRDWSALERGSESKWYARGVGLVRSRSTGGELSVLLEVHRPGR